MNKNMTTRLAAYAVHGAGLPDDVARQIGERLPAAFVPIPASGANKIFPLVSEKRKSPDRKYAITVDGTPFAVTAIGDEAKRSLLYKLYCICCNPQVRGNMVQNSDTRFTLHEH